MKKVFLLSVHVLAILLLSCQYHDESTVTPEGDVESVVVAIAEMEDEDVFSRLDVRITTDSINYYWEELDTIGIFPSKGGQVEFPITEEGVGQTFAEFEGGGWALKAGYSYAAYYPYNFFNRNSHAIPVSYLGQVQNGKNSRAHLSDYVLLAAAPVEVANGVLNFSLSHVGSVMILNLTLPEITTYKSVTVYTDDTIIPVKKTIDLQHSQLSQTVTELSDRVTLDLQNITTTTRNEEVALYMAFPSMSEGSKELKVVVYDIDDCAYTADLLKLDDTPALTIFTPNKFQRRKASPVLNEGFTIGIKNWGSDGKDYGGSVE